MIDIRKLGFTYPDGTAALKDISFSVLAGRAIGLIGPNGAGKSTLLMLLNGCLTPSSGEVVVNGVTVKAETLDSVRQAVGLVFQDPDDQLFMPTVREDVAFGPINAGLSPAQVETRVSASLQRVGIQHLAKRPPYRLSGGEKRAASIATVLSLKPQILVMDEPSSNLDPRGRKRLIDFLRSLEITRIIATHDLELVVEVCSEVVLLDAGELVVRGPVEEILNNEALMLKHGLERPHILRHRHPH